MRLLGGALGCGERRDGAARSAVQRRIDDDHRHVRRRHLRVRDGARADAIARQQAPDDVAAAERRVEVRARDGAGARAAVAARHRIVGAAVRGDNVDAMDVDAAPQVAERRGGAKRVDERLDVGVILRHLRRSIAVAENDDVIALRIRSVVDDLVCSGHRSVGGTHARWTPRQRTRSRRLTTYVRPLTSAEAGARRQVAAARSGRELAQRVDIGAKQRPGRELGSRRIGRPVKLERARVRDVGNQHGEPVRRAPSPARG
mgnify:CR=1 FL=1